MITNLLSTNRLHLLPSQDNEINAGTHDGSMNLIFYGLMFGYIIITMVNLKSISVLAIKCDKVFGSNMEIDSILQYVLGAANYRLKGDNLLFNLFHF